MTKAKAKQAPKASLEITHRRLLGTLLRPPFFLGTCETNSLIVEATFGRLETTSWCLQEIRGLGGPGGVDSRKMLERVVREGQVQENPEV